MYAYSADDLNHVNDMSHDDCETCHGTGGDVIQPGAFGNWSRTESFVLECRDCMGSGHDPACWRCRGER